MKLNAADRGQLRALLYGRSEAIADRWHRALLPAGYTPQGAARARQRLGELTDQAIALLLAPAFADEEARALGDALVRLGFREPVALGRTLEILGDALVAGLPAEYVAALQPRLVALLGEAASGFAARAQATILVEQEQARAALRLAERRLRAVVDHAPIVLFAFDQAGVVTLSEGRGLAALGRRPGELVGRSVWEGAAAVPQLPADLHRALAGESFSARACLRGLVFETSYAPLRDDRGAVTGVIGVAVDVTARQRAEAALRCVEVGLSPMERKVLPYLARPDRPNYQQIGDQLCLDGETVRDHMRGIARKLGIPARRDVVVAAAQERGLLPPAAPGR
ncbi:MAG TPA: PAS domain-containing protein [Thermomicrobiales bacterium]|nr:PAS domain-containing protein [Thermomicrobiales bacterium]